MSSLFSTVTRGNITGSEPLTIHNDKAEKNHQPTTLGSVNTQDIEAYARGRVYGNDQHIQGRMESTPVHSAL